MPTFFQIILNCIFYFNKEISSDFEIKIFETVTRSETFLFFNFEVVTQKWKNKSLTFEFVIRSKI